MENTTRESIIDEEEEVKEESIAYDIKFPLPDHVDPSLCRDEFIKTIVKANEERLSSLTPRLTAEQVQRRSKDVLQEQMHWDHEQTPETMAVIGILLKWQLRHKKNRVSVARYEAVARRSSILKELNHKCQKAAIEFLSVRLLKQLRLFSSPWPGKMDEIPYNLFSWSVDHFMARLDLKQMYLDVIHRERSSEALDCLKFRTDLHEIELLIHEIREDFREDRNICKGSYQSIRDAQYVMKAPWVKDLQKHNREVVALATEYVVGSKTSIGEINHRTADLEDLYDNATAQDPIEVRYQINWINSLVDQNLLKMTGREEKLWRELEDIRKKEGQDYVVQTHSKVAYDIIVESLKAQINDWQERYDEDLEQVELKNAVARSALQKVKDDLKTYKERQEMYIRRIAEEQKKIAKELEVKAEREAFQSRRSMRMSTVSHKGKRLSTAAQKEKRLSTAAQKEKRLSTAAQKEKRLSPAAQKEKRLSPAAQKEKRLSTGSQKQKREAQKKSVRKF